jgi:DNA-directed RNA polymerase specialized sigma24 family protein/CheY-like chemotaxis protein
MTANDEHGLVLLALAGSAEAFDALAERCRPWLYGLCFRLVHDRASAEDLVQETLLSAFRDLKGLRDPDRFRPWLSRVALNVCRVHLRRLAARPQELPGAGLAGASAHGGTDAPFGVDQALAQLDTPNQRMLALFYGDGLSQAEVGELLGLSAAAVKSRLHRVREQLRREMLAMMTEEQKARLGVAEEQPWALRTILLVEPDEQMRESLCEALSSAGYEVVELPTGEAALAEIAEHRAQMLILDKHCGEPNWIEVLTLIKVDAWSRENVPVMAFGDDPAAGRDVLLAWQAGAQVYLTRPPKTEEVVNFVNHVARMWPNDSSQEVCAK